MTLIAPISNVAAPNNDLSPCEGPRAIPTILDFTKSSSYIMDMTAPFQQQQLTTCQTLYVDNSVAGAAAITVTVNGTNQTITIKPNTCGYYNLMMVNPPVLQISSPGSTATNVYFAAMNFYIPGVVWPTV